jgi:hypothetical protein
MLGVALIVIGVLLIIGIVVKRVEVLHGVVGLIILAILYLLLVGR